MSMAVDLSTPLSADERAYLAERGRYAELERADSMHGTSGELPEGDGSAPLMRGTATYDVRDQRIAELERELQLLRGVNGEADSDEADSDEDPEPYETWTVKELDAELERRSLPVKGDKAAKVTALYDHDDAAGA